MALAEHFVYFNDDMYLVNKTKPDDFFSKGLPREVAIVNPIAPSQRYYINNVQLTTIAVINEHFKKHEVIRKDPAKWINLKYGKLLPLNFLFAPWGRFPGLLQQHIAASYLKSTFVEVWEQEQELLHHTCTHRFRDFKSDVNQWIMQEWQIANGKFEPRSLNFGKYYQIKDTETAKKAGKAILSGKYKTICLILNLLLIPLMGTSGAALATCMSYFTVFLYRSIDTRKYIKIKLVTTRNIVSITLLIIMSIVLYIENKFSFAILSALFVALIAIHARTIIIFLKELLKLVAKNQ